MILSNDVILARFDYTRVNEKRVSDHLRFAFGNEMIKLRRQFLQHDDTRKTNDSKLTTAIRLYVNVN